MMAAEYRNAAALVPCVLAHTLRPAEPGDLALIMDGWLEKQRHSPWSMRMHDGEYFPMQRNLIYAVLRFAQVTVACNPEDASHVYGFIVHGPPTSAGTPVVHWLQVKSAYHGIGLGRALLHAAVPGALEGGPRFFATQISRETGKRLAELSSRGMVYAPLLLTNLLLEARMA